MMWGTDLRGFTMSSLPLVETTLARPPRSVHDPTQHQTRNFSAVPLKTFHGTSSFARSRCGGRHCLLARACHVRAVSSKCIWRALRPFHRASRLALSPSGGMHFLLPSPPVRPFPQLSLHPLKSHLEAVPQRLQIGAVPQGRHALEQRAAVRHVLRRPGEMVRVHLRRQWQACGTTQ